MDMFVAVSLDTQELIVKQVRRTSSKFPPLNHLRLVGCAELLITNSFLLFSFTCLTNCLSSLPFSDFYWGREMYKQLGCSVRNISDHVDRNNRIAIRLAWEKSSYLTTPSLVSPGNDVWERGAKIPYWWLVTTPIWVVLLIGWSKLFFNQSMQKHYSDLDSDTTSVWNFCARSSDVISRGNQWWRRVSCFLRHQLL